MDEITSKYYGSGRYSIGCNRSDCDNLDQNYCKKLTIIEKMIYPHTIKLIFANIYMSIFLFLWKKFLWSLNFEDSKEGDFLIDFVRYQLVFMLFSTEENSYKKGLRGEING